MHNKGQQNCHFYLQSVLKELFDFFTSEGCRTTNFFKRPNKNGANQAHVRR